MRVLRQEDEDSVEEGELELWLKEWRLLGYRIHQTNSTTWLVGDERGVSLTPINGKWWVDRWIMPYNKADLAEEEFTDQSEALDWASEHLRDD